jgi:3-deoxy-7-phosphoheptulonate synthase
VDLKKRLRNVALGKAFVLQGGKHCELILKYERLKPRLGDCAELFDYCNQDMIEAKVKLLLQMSLILIWGTSKF